MSNETFYHAHKIIQERCRGRLKCVRSCPTQAIRVHDSKVTFFNDLCIDCGNCINVCPEGVFVPMSDSLEDFKSFKFQVVMPSDIFYSQFGADVHPVAIQQALKRIGFDEIADVSRVCEEIGAALLHHLNAHAEVRPLISSFCPAIVRFIQVSYPNLVKHLVPLDVPREIVAREAKRHYARKLGLKELEIGVIYISPCPAKVVSIKQPAEKEKSWIDGAIPIKDVYNLVLPEIIKIQQEAIPDKQEEFHYGRAWGMLGYFSKNVDAEKTLLVAGIDHVKLILDDIESEKLRSIECVEALACLHGCTGGVFCVKNPYVARHNSIQLKKRFGRTSTIDRKKVLENYQMGYYSFENPVLPRPTRSSPTEIGDAIKRMKKKERIFAKLPGVDCCLCGAPSCETFAEDCADNEAEITDCIFFSK